MKDIPNDVVLNLVKELKKELKTSLAINDLISKANNYLAQTDWFKSLSDEEKVKIKNKDVFLQLLDELERLKSTEIIDEKPINERMFTPQRVDIISQSIKRGIAREFLFILLGFILFFIGVIGFNYSEERVLNSILFSLFIFRYIYYATNWSIKTLKINLWK